MKALSVMFLLFASLHSPQALACSRDEAQLLCPGDRVVATNANNQSWAGRVTAVNPFKGTVSVYHDDGDLISWDIRKVAVAVGCIQGYCVGDYAVATNRNNQSWAGRIQAVNPHNQTLVIYHDDGDLINWQINQVSLGLGCIQGYCVGDRAVATNNNNQSWAGRIKAVNPYSQTLVIYHDDGDLISWQIQNVGNAEYCAEYGSEVRRHRRYPELNQSSYRVPKWMYGLKR